MTSRCECDAAESLLAFVADAESSGSKGTADESGMRLHQHIETFIIDGGRANEEFVHSIIVKRGRLAIIPTPNRDAEPVLARFFACSATVSFLSVLYEVGLYSITPAAVPFCAMTVHSVRNV